MSDAANPPIEKQILFIEVKPETGLKKIVQKLQIQCHDLQFEISNSAEVALATELISHRSYVRWFVKDMEYIYIACGLSSSFIESLKTKDF